MRVKFLKLSSISLITSLCIALVLLFMILFLTPTVRCGAGEEQSIILLREVYSKLAEAEASGADISNASQLLNKALTLLKSIDVNPEDRELLLQEAIKIINDVDSMIPTLVDEGQKNIFMRNVYMVLSVSSIASSILLAYLLTPRIFWSLWLKARRNWLVKVSGKGGRGSIDRRRG